MSKKAAILELRSQGKSYNEIQKMVGCSKGTIAYHCGEGQKQKFFLRGKIDKFFRRTLKKRNADYWEKRGPLDRPLYRKVIDFQRIREGSKKKERPVRTFTKQQVIEKFGIKAKCYLTGRSIHLFETDSYHFDHVVPTAKGGSAEIDNLEIACPEANIAKHTMTPQELLSLCAEILVHHGYKVEAPDIPTV